MADQLTQFDYLLNAFEQASQHAAPATVGYSAKRAALYAYVRRMEAMAKPLTDAAWNAEQMAETATTLEEALAALKRVAADIRKVAAQ